MTAISWTDETWNPTVGCTRVSAGCINCYAEHAAAMVNRTQGARSVYSDLLRVVDGDPRWNGTVKLLPARLDIPLCWRKGRRVFVNSMSDLFHEGLTNEEIAAVFGVMASTPQHTFQVLTKRAERMRDWFEWVQERAVDGMSMFPNDTEDWRIGQMLAVAARKAGAEVKHARAPWPLPNVWLGVSVENQAAADERIPLLLDTPAAVRFLSCEPLLDAVDLRGYLGNVVGEVAEAGSARTVALTVRHGIGWVIAGCESGAGARRADPAWYRALRDQCAAAGVPFFLKQAVEQYPPEPDEDPRHVGYPSHADMLRAFNNPPPTVTCGPGSRRKKQGVIELPYLDGVQHAAFPAPRPEVSL